MQNHSNLRLLVNNPWGGVGGGRPVYQSILLIPLLLTYIASSLLCCFIILLCHHCCWCLEPANSTKWMSQMLLAALSTADLNFPNYFIFGDGDGGRLTRNWNIHIILGVHTWHQSITIHWYQDADNAEITGESSSILQIFFNVSR